MQEGRSSAYVKGTVHRGELPILLVIHDDDGEWQFLDGEPMDESDLDAVVVHVAHVWDEHPELRVLLDLPEGWAAERGSVGEEWRRYEWAAD